MIIFTNRVVKYILFLLIVTACNSQSDSVEMTSVMDSAVLDNNIVITEDMEKMIDFNEFKFDLPSDLREKSTSVSSNIVDLNKNWKLEIPLNYYRASQSLTVIYKCYDSLSNMLIDHLNTSTKKTNILETEGMFYINILDGNGNPIQLNSDTPLYLIPTNKKVLKDQTVKVFDGIQDSLGLLWNDTPEEYVFKRSKRDTYDPVNGHQTIIFQSDLNETGFSLTHLGWINLDRFTDLKGNYEFKVVCKEPRNVSYSFVIESRSAIVPCNIFHKDTLIMTNLKKGIKGTIVGIGEAEDGIYFNFLEVNGGIEQATFPKLEKTQMSDLKRRLAEKFDNLAN